jgi:kinesin family protein C1
LTHAGKKWEIKQAGDNTYITNCTCLEISTPEDMNKTLQYASSNRSTGYTQCNDKSSRSHSILTLKLKLSSHSAGEERSGVLNLIDLAGSERISESGSEGQRLKETQNINKSLSVFGNVIGSLLKKDSHVPFRDSKLTYLLKNQLSGNSRMLMFVNISPELSHLNETLCSLRFAQKVKECKLGWANRNVARKV